MNEIKCSVLSCSEVFRTEEQLAPQARFLCRKHTGKCTTLWKESHWEKERDSRLEERQPVDLQNGWFEMDWFKKPSPFTPTGSWTEFGSVAECLADSSWNIRSENNHIYSESMSWSPSKQMAQNIEDFNALRAKLGYSL